MRGESLASVIVKLLHCSLLRRFMLPCLRRLRCQMLQIQHGSIKGFGCSASLCHTCHNIKRKVLGNRSTTDWGHADLATANRLHRSDRSYQTGQTGLSRDRFTFVLRVWNIVSRRRRMEYSLCRLILRGLQLMILYKSAI